MKGLDTAARLCQYDIRLSMVTSLTMLLSPRTDSASPTFSLDGSSSHAREHLLSTILPLVCATLRFVIESEPGLLGELAASWHYLPTCAFQRVVVVLNYADLLSFFFPLLLSLSRVRSMINDSVQMVLGRQSSLHPQLPSSKRVSP
jgi:hypothetical protein